jgi:hypothetical protein
VSAVIGRFDRPATNAACSVVGRGWEVLLVGRSGGDLMVGTATVLASPAQDRTSQKKTDQAKSEERSHLEGSLPMQYLSL